MSSDSFGKLTSTQNLLLGTMSGLCCKLTNYPLLSWKNASQQGLPLQFGLQVYRGLPMAMFNLGATTAVQFWATGFFQRLLQRGKDATAMDKMLGSFLGGAFSGIPGSMWELTMIQQQRFGGSIVSTPARIIQAHGPTMYMRGMSCTMGRESLFSMSMLSVTPLIQEMMVEKFNMDSNMGLAAGALAGSIFAAVATHPMDTIKTCMQGDIEQKTYKGVSGTYTALMNERGVAGLFKGLNWRIVLIATTFFLVNKFKVVILPIAFPDAIGDTKEEKKNTNK